MTKILHRSGVAWKRKGRPDIVQFVDDGFILGKTEPTWANSGCRIPQASLTRNETINLVTSYDGQIIEGLHLPYGRVEVRHKNVTVRDCLINIGWVPNGTGAGQRLMIQMNAAVVTNVNYNTSGLNLEYVTCDPINAGANGTADDYNVGGFYFLSGTRVYRCKARHVTDSFMPDEKPSTPVAPVQVLGCYGENRFLSVTPLANDGTHCDGVQFAGGAGHIVRGCAFHNPVGGVKDPASGFTVVGQNVVLTPYHSIISDLTIDSNWFYGSYTQVSNWVPTSYGFGGGVCPRVTVTNNIHQGQCVWPILFTPNSATTATISGNKVGPAGLKWNNGTLAPGAAVNATIAANNTNNP